MKSCLLSLLALLWSLPLFAQQASPVPFTGATPGFHQTHTGQILFSPTAVPVDGYPGAAYIGLSTYPLAPRSGLYFTAFLGSSLTQALHRLAPHLPQQELARTGTYQFSFYVDKQLIYLANLPAGAVDPTSKNKETVLHQALLNDDHPASEWGRALWYRFLANGGEKALSPGQHLLRLEIRPYFQHPLLRDGPILAAGQVALDVIAASALSKPVR
ncbi:hypothetical protein [Hymenobacter psychrotolerans]|uniref:Uncharacterized protein n=1 Tax=Hymenobacter psychrotolerans DSM 18569 TaxID=1121959 RepID=A0A1M7H5A7_9BACT|nr:hypothetical protein [Hymenobacter psychrotolerans]SHM23814.1 hypothetical protein SAMN02746009_04162 [Hymenobacter psychrotolerans DSM 18569]